jgi:hypothetical protein
MARIGSLNILSSGISIDDLNAKLGVQTQHGLPIGEGPNNPFNWTAAPTAGQILIGTSSSSDPVLGTLTAGTGISIANSPGGITITATGATGGFSWNPAPGSMPVMPQNGYVVSGGSSVLLTITGAAVLGDIIQIVGNNTLWTLTGATMNIVTMQGTTLDAKTGYDTITLVCVAAPNTYVATATQGNIEVSP